MFGDFTAVARTQEPDEAFGYLCVMVNVAINAARNAQEELRRSNEQLAQTNQRLQQTVAEQKRAEEATRESQRLLQAIVDNSTAVVYVKDLQGRYLLVNRRFSELFHLASETVLGKTDYDIDMFSRETADAFRAMDQRVAAAGHALTEEETVPQDDGSHTYLSVKFPLHDATGRAYAVSGISTDITERKREEKTQAQLAAIIQSSDDAIISTTLDGIISSWNPGAQKLFGYSAEEALGQLTTMLIPSERQNEEPEILRRIARGEATEHFETVRLRKDGTRVDVSVNMSPVRNQRGELIGASKIARDIAERRHAEQKLQAQLARLDLLGRTTHAIGERQDLQSILAVVVRSLEDHLPIDFGCVCLYEQGSESLTVTSVGVKSQPLARELAMSERAHIRVDGNGLSRCIHGQLVYEPDIGQVEYPFPQRLARGGLRSLVIAPLLSESSVFGVLVAARRAAHGFSSGDCEFLRQLSEHVGLAASQAQVYAALQRAYEELRQTQRAVLEQERLRALGQMASGVAHDINNAISPVALYTEALLEREPGLSERARQYLVTIQRAIDDVAQTVSRMREFYRPREPQQLLARVDLNRLIEQVIDLTRARWSDLPQRRGIVIDVQTNLAADLPAIQGAESEIRDALTNLVFNAVDAMPEGGPLSLRTTVVSGAVCAEVRDAGVGMDEDTRRRCVEPFFTTKGERGTGLGLASVYGMVERHSGSLEIESEPGKGTTVRLVFPAVASEVASTVADFAPRTPTRRLRMLIVDDDPLIIEALRASLQSDGHHVTAADGGQAGIDAFIAAEKGDEPFEVVITDLGMPYVDGRKVVSTIRAASRTTPIILLTGWGQRLAAENDVPLGVNRVLSKPPRLHELRIALAELSESAAHL
jgi:PAS domain S-box-containing protein